MDDRDPLLAMLAVGHAPLRRLYPQMLALRRIALGAGFACYLATALVTCAMLWIAWRHDDYNPVLTGIVAVTQVLALLIFLVKMGIRPHLFAAAAVTLQDAAWQRDAELAPEAEEQPTSSTDGIVGERSFGPFRWPGTGRAVWLVAAGAMYLIVGLGGVAVSLYLLSLPDEKASTWPLAPYSLVLGLLGIVLCGFALVLLAYARQLHAGSLAIVVDAVGLRGGRFGPRRRETLLRWQDARTFTRVQAPSKGLSSREVVHVLAGEEAAVSWTVPADAPPAVLDANTRLLEQIAARTNLPLLDLSASVDTFAAWPVDTIARWATRPGAPVQRRHVRIMRLVAQGVALLLALLSLYGVMAGLQWYEPRYYDGLLPHIHTQQPLYADTLATPTGTWPVQNSGGIASEYVGNAYRLSLKGEPFVPFFAPVMPATYGDSAVAVTLHHTDSDDIGGSGLVVRTGPAKHLQIIFRLSGDVWALALMSDTPDSLYMRDWTVLADGLDDTIRNSFSADHRLLVVTRGDEYICYIDGHFVGIAHDSTLTSGRVGLFVDIVAGQATFSDFTVYRV